MCWAQLDDVIVCANCLAEHSSAEKQRERRGAAYAGMDLQPSAKDCIRLWQRGKRGRERRAQGWV